VSTRTSTARHWPAKPSVLPPPDDPPVLPRPPHWTEAAVCAQVGDDFWFPEKGGSTREAKRVCHGCEVKGECLDYALENDERFGIWGGMSERERRRLKRAVA
jgi:WhiB family transcriptional regulator, redox-sensing transcriptional regulator